MADSKKRYSWETVVILILIIAAVLGLFELRVVSWFAPYVAVAVAALLIYVPVIHAGIRHERISYFDRSFGAVRRSVIIFLITLCLVMPVFLVADHAWQEWVFRRVFIPKMVPLLWLAIVDQLFLVAIPEEIFFRGWLQTRLNKLFAAKWNVLGVSVGWAWLLTAFLFALAHSIIFYQWWHFAIFFPALLFGWLREKTGSITAPALFHCMSNIAVQWIGISYI